MTIILNLKAVKGSIVGTVKCSEIDKIQVSSKCKIRYCWFTYARLISFHTTYDMSTVILLLFYSL